MGTSFSSLLSQTVHFLHPCVSPVFHCGLVYTVCIIFHFLGHLLYIIHMLVSYFLIHFIYHYTCFTFSQFLYFNRADIYYSDPSIPYITYPSNILIYLFLSNLFPYIYIFFFLLLPNRNIIAKYLKATRPPGGERVSSFFLKGPRCRKFLFSSTGHTLLGNYN